VHDTRFIGFVTACLGATLGFIIDYDPNQPLSFMAFGIVLIGVLLGLISVAWGYFTIIKS